MKCSIQGVQFDAAGLVPVVVQDVTDGRVLMLAYADARAIALTRETRRAHFYSRSRQSIWEKGATSGNVLQVQGIRVDCDSDALLYLVRPTGPACHTGAHSCFYRFLDSESGRASNPILVELAEVIADRAENPTEKSYVSRLLTGSPEGRLRKIGEEASEVMLAGALERKNLPAEVADLWFHTLIVLKAAGADYRAALDALIHRRR